MIKSIDPKNKKFYFFQEEEYDLMDSKEVFDKVEELRISCNTVILRIPNAMFPNVRKISAPDSVIFENNYDGKLIATDGEILNVFG